MNDTPDRSSKITAQLKKLTEANAKYKSLLMLAKERIQQQEEELEIARKEKVEWEQQAEVRHEPVSNDELRIQQNNAVDAFSTTVGDEVMTNIVRICQLVKSENLSNNGVDEIWALFELEIVQVSELDMGDSSTRKVKEWKRFDTEAELQDFILRDTGEPLILPQYSLSLEQSAIIQKESNAQVSRIIEEFRRFRVKAELSRKQAESQIRDLQSSSVQSAARRIGESSSETLTINTDQQIRLLNSQVRQLQADFATQESRWKREYETLMAENAALKSSGSETLLASQWRQRYENCLLEKKEIEVLLNCSNDRESGKQNGDFEIMYRDLKESFRLYRKKTKEIFEAQERGDLPTLSEVDKFIIVDASSAEAKLSYLKNLMVNYFTSDLSVRDHMESAICTVLQFSPAEILRIKDRKKAWSDTWF